MTDLHSLLARVEKAEGADREIDFAIAEALDGVNRVSSAARLRYTASLDAAVALVEKVFPRCGYGASLRWPEISRGPDEVAHGWIHHGDDTHEGDAHTPALALIAALLRALDASPPHSGAGKP